MTDGGPAAPLLFPHLEPPAIGTPVAVADGIEWVRLPLPFRLDHVNVFLIADEGGVAVVDTGIGDDATRALWEALLDGPLRGRPITRIIATHFHPDHVGMAGWLAERTGAPLLMSQTEYLTCLTIQLDPDAANAEPYRAFYLAHGLDPAVADRLLTNGHRYLRMITGLPRTFRRLIAGETLRIGGRRFDVLSGRGHSPEQVMLHCPADRLLLAADQVLARISPNISVQANDPEGDPLGIYLRSLAALKEAIPADTLVLPGHNLPFVGLHARVNELAAHHALRCDAILAACRGRRLSAVGGGAGAGGVRPGHRRPAPDELRVQRGARPCQPAAAPGPAGVRGRALRGRVSGLRGSGPRSAGARPPRPEFRGPACSSRRACGTLPAS